MNFLSELRVFWYSCDWRFGRDDDDRRPMHKHSCHLRKFSGHKILIKKREECQAEGLPWGVPLWNAW